MFEDIIIFVQKCMCMAGQSIHMPGCPPRLARLLENECKEGRGVQEFHCAHTFAPFLCFVGDSH